MSVALTCTNVNITVDNLNITDAGSLTLRNVTFRTGNVYVTGTGAGGSGGRLSVENTTHDGSQAWWQNGNITIGGHVNISGVKVYLNGSADGSAGINNTNTGYLDIRGNASNITAGETTTNGYFFWNAYGSNLSLQDTDIFYAGYSDSRYGRGLTINTTAVNMSHIYIYEPYMGITLLNGADNIAFTNITLFGNTGIGPNSWSYYGINIQESSHLSFTHLNISSFLHHSALVQNSHHINFTNITGSNISTLGLSGSFTRFAFSNVTNVLFNDSLLLWPQISSVDSFATAAIVCIDCRNHAYGNITILDVNGAYGMYFSGTSTDILMTDILTQSFSSGSPVVVTTNSNSSITIANSNISDALNSLSVGPGNLTVLNTTFMGTTYTDATSNVSVLWPFSVYVQDQSGLPLQNARIAMYATTASNYGPHQNMSNATSTSGFVRYLNITEYLRDAVKQYVQGNYTLNVSKAGYDNASMSLNITGANSTTITLAITPLNLTAVSIIPNTTTTLNTSTDLTGYATTLVSGSAPTFFFNWTVNNTPIYSGHSGGIDGINTNISLINHTRTSGGDTWNLLAYAHSNYTEVNSTVWNVSVTVPHTWASVDNVTLIAINSTQNATCTYWYNDSDNHSQGASYIVWYVNGSLAQNSTAQNNQSNLSETYFIKGQTVNCSVYAYNGYNWTPQVSATIVVNNSAPTAAGVVMTPDNGTKATTFTCTFNALTDPDGDPIVNTRYAFRDTDNTTVLQAYSANNSFDCNSYAACAKDDHITCDAYADDGQYLSSHYSANASINNTAPSVTYVSLTYDPATPNSTCNFTWADLDSDSINVTARFYRNDVLQAGNTSYGKPGHASPSAHANLTLNGTLAVNDNWVCELRIDDRDANSTWRNSSTLVVGAGLPIVGAADTNESVVNESTAFHFNWTWNSTGYPGDGPYTHYVCNGTVGFSNSTGCGESTLCTISESSRNATCNATSSSTDASSERAYVYIVTANGTASSAGLVLYAVNHRPTATNATINVTTDGVNNLYTCALRDWADPDNDTLTTRYTFYNNATGETLQANSTDKTYSIGTTGAAGMNGTPINCTALVSDAVFDSTSYGNSSHLSIYSLATNGTLALLSPLSITALIRNNSAVAANMTVTSPAGASNWSAMAFDDGTGRYVKSYSTNDIITLGNYTITSIVVNDSRNQSYLYKNNEYFTIALASGSTSGGTSGGTTREVEPIVTYLPGENVTTIVEVTKPYCGDGVCQDEESATSCWRDCKVNIDTLLTFCLKKDQTQPCNWRQHWFATTVIGLVVIITVGAFYAYEIRR